MRYFVLCCQLIFIFSCNNSAVKENLNIKEAEKEVMDIHDDVMPRMGEVVFLTEAIDSMIKVEKDSTKRDELSLIYEALVKSDKDMMHWMRTYESPMEPYDSNTINYINNQQEKVIKLRALILKSISDGKTALQNH
jgi:hypothetical protein